MEQKIKEGLRMEEIRPKIEKFTKMREPTIHIRQPSPRQPPRIHKSECSIRLSPSPIKFEDNPQPPPTYANPLTKKSANPKNFMSVLQLQKQQY